MTRIGYYQFCPQFGQVDANLAQIESALKGVDADLIVLPELALTGYYFAGRKELETLAEDPQDSVSVERLSALCRRERFCLVTGFAEKCDSLCYNSSLLIGPEGLAHVYRKIHLFDKEKDCFDAGDLPLRVVEMAGIRIGMMICFDWIFPEVARALALEGADVLCHPANLVLSYCQQAMMVRCTENLVFAVTANRYGTEVRPHGELSFTGQSQVVAPRGTLLHRSSPDQDDLYVVDVDLEQARDKALTTRNDIFGDRRPSFYRTLCPH